MIGLEIQGWIKQHNKNQQPGSRYELGEACNVCFVLTVSELLHQLNSLFLGSS